MRKPGRDGKQGDNRYAGTGLHRMATNAGCVGPRYGRPRPGRPRLFYLVAGMVQDLEPLLELSEKAALILYTLEANVHVTVALGSVLVMSDDAEDAAIVTSDYVRHFSDRTGFIGQFDTNLDRCLVDSGN